jgi:hypothetical protein
MLRLLRLLTGLFHLSSGWGVGVARSAGLRDREGRGGRFPPSARQHHSAKGCGMKF